jgi:hypothetical protein
MQALADFSVSNVNFALWSGGPEIFPGCRFNVLNVQLQKYIYYWSLEIFKSTFCSYFFFWFWDVQLYHGENKLIFTEMMMRSALY